MGSAIKTAFDGPYMDPLNARDYYVNVLADNMNLWVNAPHHFNAPYTSLINASMMGKTRLAKELSTKIPMVSICVREGNDGYPEASSGALLYYLMHPPYDTSKSIADNLSRIEKHYLALFVGIVHCLDAWAQQYGPPTESHFLRQRLWHHLAQPDRPSNQSYRAANEPKEDAEGFWKDATSWAVKNETQTEDDLMQMLSSAWTKIEPFLSVVGREQNQMLLIFWTKLERWFNIKFTAVCIVQLMMRNLSICLL
jgi:hypothetical protein